jgi:hypothetical protein
VLQGCKVLRQRPNQDVGIWDRFVLAAVLT